RMTAHALGGRPLRIARLALLRRIHFAYFELTSFDHAWQGAHDPCRYFRVRAPGLKHLWFWPMLELGSARQAVCPAESRSYHSTRAKPCPGAGRDGAGDAAAARHCGGALSVWRPLHQLS